MSKTLCRGYRYGPVAQLGARSVRIREVEGSNPFRSTMQKAAFVSRQKRLFAMISAKDF